ncbi:MAG: class I SAM-dependent DNA methyltransferase [Planctomycetia bacterium]
MPLSWNEIRSNAIAFTREWAEETREEAEAKSFWDAFFSVFGVKRRAVASFEEPVKKLSGTWGFIDLFWKGRLLVEHKSRGKPLDKANSQAMEYIQGLKNAGRDAELPQYVIVSDFARLALHDLDTGESVEFPLSDFPARVHLFAFIPGYKLHSLTPQDPVNIQAVELLGKLHDALEVGGYGGHDLERFLVRVLFCLFAEDTGIFDPEAFKLFVENHTKEDGSDLGSQMARLFQVLDTPIEKRSKNLLEELAALPYVNGRLFADRLDIADTTRPMRDALVTCCGLDWSRISPAVFGSLFQSVMEPKERRRIGAHYTSERDILKLVRSLFLDDLRAEFDRLTASKGTQRTIRLREFQEKLGRLTFFDPACGCGNFLVVTYRELRLLEIDVLKVLKTDGQRVLNVADLCHVNVDAMYGIEISEFPVRIAEVALWLVDHQMNQRLGEAFGESFVRLPLDKSATIRHANALRLDWNDVLPAAKCGYVLGNPPFVGPRQQSIENKEDLRLVTGKLKGVGELDYVSAWYFKCCDYIQFSSIQAAFVSTNSITQGEQVGILWKELLGRGLKVNFGHRTFGWKSEARGPAHVHVVIVGFSFVDVARKHIVDYEKGLSNPSKADVSCVNPYLIQFGDVLLDSRSKPLCNAPSFSFGNMPNDGGALLFDDVERNDILAKDPEIESFIRPILGSREFIRGLKKWCFWLVDISPNELKRHPVVLERLRLVQASRAASTRPATIKLANAPSRFGEIRQPKKTYLAIPKTSSENRRFIPMAFLDPTIIAGSELFTCETAEMYHFGVLSSTMHMAWVRQVCGRLKSDYRYSNKLVYNNYPWPMDLADSQRKAVESKAQAVLDARQQFPDATLADLYDSLAMPPALSKAHADLDRAVERCYRKEPFTSDRERVEYLFGLYERLATPLTAVPKKQRGVGKKKADDS